MDKEIEIYVDRTKISFIGKFYCIIDGVKLAYGQDLKREDLLQYIADYNKQQRRKK